MRKLDRMRKFDRLRSVARSAGDHRRVPLWEKLAGLAAIVTVAVVAWQGCETRESNDLFREQLEISELSAHPILVPVPPDAEVPLIDAETNFVRFRVQNATNAPALGGVAVIMPLAAGEREEEGAPPYPTCGEEVGAAGHDAFQLIPPVPPGATITVEFDNAPFTAPAEQVLCATLGYSDATGQHRLTDWIWTQREVFGSGPPDDEPRVVWMPTEIQLVDGVAPGWWEL